MNKGKLKLNNNEDRRDRGTSNVLQAVRCHQQHDMKPPRRPHHKRLKSTRSEVLRSFGSPSVELR